MEKKFSKIEADNLYDMLFDGEGEPRACTDKAVLNDFNMLENKPVYVETDRSA